MIKNMKSDLPLEKPINKVGLLEEELSYKIRGIFIEISKKYSYQFKEQFYHNLCIEYFIKNGVRFKSKPKIILRSLELKNIIGYHMPDFLVDEKIIIEIKAQRQIFSEHINQLTKYLKLSEYEIGFLVNFGSPMVQVIRRISSNVNIIADVRRDTLRCAEAR